MLSIRPLSGVKRTRSGHRRNVDPTPGCGWRPRTGCARGVPSPDEWDAVALTFAEPVSSTPSNFNRKLEYQKSGIA